MSFTGTDGNCPPEHSITVIKPGCICAWLLGELTQRGIVHSAIYAKYVAMYVIQALFSLGHEPTRIVPIDHVIYKYNCNMAKLPTVE